MRDREKYEQAVQLLNESGYSFILVDLTEVQQRADELEVPEPDEDECDAIVLRISDGVWETVWKDIADEL